MNPKVPLSYDIHVPSSDKRCGPNVMAATGSASTFAWKWVRAPRPECSANEDNNSVRYAMKNDEQAIPSCGVFLKGALF